MSKWGIVIVAVAVGSLVVITGWSCLFSLTSVPPVRAPSRLAHPRPRVTVENHSWASYRSYDLGLAFEYPSDWRLVSCPFDDCVEFENFDEDAERPSALDCLGVGAIRLYVRRVEGPVSCDYDGTATCFGDDYFYHYSTSTLSVNGVTSTIIVGTTIVTANERCVGAVVAVPRSGSLSYEFYLVGGDLLGTGLNQLLRSVTFL